jgi:hypothetical protein
MVKGWIPTLSSWPLRSLSTKTRFIISPSPTILLVSITDEILGTLTPGRGFPQLLGHPFIGGGVGHCGVEDTTGVQLDDDKDENGTKEQVVDHSEVTGPDVVSVVLEEGFPGLVSGGGWSELSRYF